LHFVTQSLLITETNKRFGTAAAKVVVEMVRYRGGCSNFQFSFKGIENKKGSSLYTPQKMRDAIIAYSMRQKN
jgi:hypothetical protein